MTTVNLAMRRQKEEKRKRRIVVILLAIVVIAAGVLVAGVRFGWFSRHAPLLSGDFFPGLSDKAAAGHLPEMTEEEIREQMQRTADASKFSFKINAQPVFESGSGAGSLRIENPAHNVYPFVVEIYLAATGEKIYDSGGVPPDHHIDMAKLDVSLDKGTHEAYANINAYDPDTGAYQGKSIVNLSIIVQK